MTEYDFSPEAYDRYMATQRRIGDWVTTANQHPPMDPFIVYPSDDGMGNYHHNASYDPRYGDEMLHRGRRRHRRPFVDPPPSPIGIFPPAGSQFGHQDHLAHPPMGPHMQHPPAPAFAPSRTHSMNGVQPINTPAHSVQNVPLTPSYHAGMQPAPHIIPGTENSALVLPTSQPPHFSSHPHLPMSNYERDARYRRSLSRSYSRDSYGRSYSSDSRDSYRSDYRDRPYTGHRSVNHQGLGYRTVHPSTNAPTIIQPANGYPIVVPINGGSGGYVVVPAQGQTVSVVDPRNPHKSYGYGYKEPSFFDRFFSSKSWGRGNSTYRRRQRSQPSFFAM